METFSNSLKDVSFLKGKISLCVTQVDSEIKEDHDKEGKPFHVIDRLKEVAQIWKPEESRATQIANYCLDNVQVFY